MVVRRHQVAGVNLGVTGTPGQTERSGFDPGVRHRALPACAHPDFAGPPTRAGQMPGEWRVATHADQPRRGPLPTPRAAIERAGFAAIAPESVFVPPTEVVDALANAERILVVSHTPPDGDCVGTAIASARALRALGKQAHAVVDDALPRSLAGLDDRGDLHRAADITDFEPDLVLLVDVAQTDRIGDSARFVKAAPKIAIIDHHRADPSPEALGVAADTPIAAWIDEHADSASLMAAGALRTLAARTGQLETLEHADIMDPLAAGAATDTGWFSKPTTRPESLHVFKHLLDSSTERLGGLQRALSFQLPQDALHHLDRTVQVAHTTQGKQDLVSMIANRHSLETALDIAQTTDPEVGAGDIRGALMDRLDQAAHSYGLAVLLIEDEPKKIRVSTRSHDPETAGALARALGGGGKHGAGGAVVEGTLSRAKRKLKLAMESLADQQTAQLFLMGST